MCNSECLDSELLLAAVLEVPRSYLYTHPANNLTQDQQSRFNTLLQRRKRGEPIAYILGTKAFWTLDLEVNQDTLIPRPATELLVELALHYLPATAACQVIDLGTGSGAIALSLAQERPHWQLTASDNYPNTLAVAKRNAERYQLSHINFVLSDWCKQLPAMQVDAIVSNPPYIRMDDAHLEQGDLRFEPQHALASGRDGLTALRTIITESHTLLKPGGYLLVEHGYDQGEAVRNLMKVADYIEIKQYRDLESHERVVVGRIDPSAKPC